MKQPIVYNKEGVNFAESWLGENTCVLVAKRGKNCLIGANSIVTKDIPDYYVIIGVSVKIVKRYWHKSNTWKKIREKGEFFN